MDKTNMETHAERSIAEATYVEERGAIDENESQVPSTPLPTTIEDEAIFTLNNMATQIPPIDIHTTQHPIFHAMSFTQLMEDEAFDNTPTCSPHYEATRVRQESEYTNGTGFDTNSTHNLGAEETLPRQQQRRQLRDENADPLLSLQSSTQESNRIIDLLRLPMSEVCVRQAKREAFVDYTNSLILTSDQYIESMKAKNAKKEEITKAKEEKRVEREKKRLHALKEKNAIQERRSYARQAKASRKDWEVQQQLFEHRMRSILWEGGSLEGVCLRSLHIDQPYHAFARRCRMEKLKRARATTISRHSPHNQA